MNKNFAIKQYNSYMKETFMLSYAVASISFDDSTGAPKKAFKERNEVLNYFQSLLFSRSISKEYQSLISSLDKYYDSLSSKYKRIVDISKKELSMNVKVPVEVMNEYQKACSEQRYHDHRSQRIHLLQQPTKCDHPGRCEKHRSKCILLLHLSTKCNHPRQCYQNRRLRLF